MLDRTAARVAPFPPEIASTWAASELVAFLRDDYPDLCTNFIGMCWQEHSGRRLYGCPKA